MSFVRDGESFIYKWIDCRLFLYWMVTSLYWMRLSMQISIYVFGFLYTWRPKIPSAFLETRISRKERFPFSSICNEVDIRILIVEENKEFTEFSSIMTPYHECIVYITETNFWFFERFSESLFLKMLHKDIGLQEK